MMHIIERMPIVINPDYAHSVMVEMGVLPLVPYPGAKVNWRSKCLSCGDTENCAPHFSTVHGRWKKWQGGGEKLGACNACAKRATAEHQRVKGFATAARQLAEADWELLTPVSKYKNQKTRCDVRCVRCLALNSGEPDTLKSNKKCECSKVARQPLSEYRPDLFQQIHPTLNRGLNFARVGTGTRRRIWWLCSESSADFAHEYCVAPANRVHPSGGCPYCSGLRPIPGVSDFATLAKQAVPGFEPLSEFSSTQPLMKDPDTWEKVPIDPRRVSPRSNLTANWICPDCSFPYPATFNDRFGGQGCPACAGKKVHIGVNDLAFLEPDISSEWHPTKNGALTPQDFVRFSNKQAHWKCDKGHEWSAVIVSRTKMRSGCPSCAETGYRPERAGMLYFLQNQTLQARKFGITNVDAKTIRLVKFERAGWEVLFTLQSTDGYVAKDVEKTVKVWIRDTLKLPKALQATDMPQTAGHTETFPLYLGPSNLKIIDFYKQAWASRLK